MRQLRKEILENAEKMRQQLNNRDKRQLARQIEHADMVIRYLETNPRKEFVEKELEKVQRQIAFVYENYELWKKSNPDILSRVLKTKTKPEVYYHNQMDIPALRKREDMLKYILDI